MMTCNNLLVILDAGLFFVGMLFSFAGAFILIRRAAGNEIQAITAQTARLAQKGLAEEVSGLVGNATALLESLHQMVLTMRGVGLFLTTIGCLMMVGSVYIAFRLIQV